MKTLFLNPPFIDRYDSAGARFQATRRSKSMWYPVWLAHAAALRPELSDLLDGPASGISAEEAVKKAAAYDCVVFYTSTPSFANDAMIASAIKEKNKKSLIIFTGPHVSVLPVESLEACPAIDAVAIGEFDLTIKDIQDGKGLKDVPGLVFRHNGRSVKNVSRPPVEDLDTLPFASPVYKKYLPIKKYYLPFTYFPYISIYTGRGCPYQCTFCLWPQTFTGRCYRKRSIANIMDEVRFIKNEMPYIKEIFFDDDTFSVDKKWVLDFCDAIAPLGVTWSINARADVPLDVLKNLKKAGCRLLVVGYESGNDGILENVKKGVTTAQMVEFTKNCNIAGLMIHGTFVMGLPGENKETITETIEFAKELDLDTVQCSIITPLPGTELYEDLVAQGLLMSAVLVSENGFQLCPVNYPDLSNEEIQAGARRFHKEFYMRPAYFYKLIKHVLKGPDEARRVFCIGQEYVRYVLKHGSF